MNRRLAALILAVPLTLAALTGCTSTPGGGGDDSGWPADVTNKFLTSCEDSSGGQTAYCECSLETLQENFTLDEYNDLEANVNSEKTKEVLSEIVSACQSEVK